MRVRVRERERERDRDASCVYLLAASAHPSLQTAIFITSLLGDII